jgi:hypothetical protein
MSEPAANPFQPAVASVLTGPGRIQFMEAYRYVFNSPSWTLNLLLVTVCQLIPIIGPIVVLGYQFEIVEALQRDPRQTYPEFNFDRFVDYLKRGLWPFLVSLLVGVVLSIPLTIVMYVLMAIVFVAAGAGGNDPSVFLVVVGMAFVFLLVLGISLLMWLVVIPMVLRAGLAQDFAEGFNLDFIKSFTAKVWREVLMCGLFMMFSGMLLMLVGAIVFCVGMYVAMALVTLAYAHFYFQLYQVYLARGGKPIPLKPVANPVAAQIV